jgi:hypothetical protein
MKTPSTLLVLTSIAFGSLTIHAAQLAHDGFADTAYPPAGISGQGPAVSGFTGTWSGSGSISGDTNLIYAPGGITLDSDGYSYIRTDGAATRPMDVSTSGPFAAYLNSAQTDIGGDNTGTLFGSFLMTSPNASGSGFIELNNGGARSFRLGINNGAWSRRIAGGGWGTLDGAPAVVAGVTNLVVYSITFDRGDGRAAIDVWINPTLGAGTPAPTSSFDVGDVIAFDDVEMGLYFGEAGYMDEIRFGESFVDVTPFTAPIETIYDGFASGDYSLTAINGQNPTVTGFSGAWVGNGSVDAANLSYLGLMTTGYSYLRADGSASRLVNTSFGGPFDQYLNSAETDLGGDNTGTLYFSFLMTSPNATGSGYFELQESGTRVFRIGINNGLFSRRILGGSWGGITGSPAVVAGQSNLIVVGIDFDGGNADVSMWVNPTSLGGAAPAPTQVLTDVGSLAFDGLMMGLFFGESAYLDELRFGSTYGAVTPAGAVPVVIPIPSIGSSGNSLTVSFDSETGLTYSLESNDDLSGSWSHVVSAGFISGDGSNKTFTVSPAPPLPVYYRIRVE